jgi:cap1 methyltransferase
VYENKMDISAQICKSFDSLKDNKPIINFTDNHYPGGCDNIINLKFSPSTVHISNSVNPVNVDIELYLKLEDNKDILGVFGSNITQQVRKNTNPFEQIGKSIFNNRAAIKFANSDAIHKLSNTIFTFDHQQDDKNFTFADIAAGPGSFTQELQWRFPKSVGYGITLKNPKELDWNPRIIDMDRFTAFYGKNGTGDLYKYWKDFINFVINKNNGGLDLITADGGFDSRDRIRDQEFLSSRLLLTQILVGIGVTKLGGNCFIKAFALVTKLSGQLLFILSQCFEKIIKFKPVSSRPGNAEFYIIGLNRKSKTHFDLLEKAANYYEDDIYLESIFDETLPNDFVKWLTDINNQGVKNQNEVIVNSINFVEGREVNVEKYNISKFLKIWALPDNI